MSHYCNHSWSTHLTQAEKWQWEECIQASITPHDLLWFFNKASLSLSPLPHDAHALNTLPQQLILREDNAWNPIVGLTPYHRSTVKKSTTPSYISYPYLQPKDCFDHAKHLRRIYHETPAIPDTQATGASASTMDADVARPAVAPSSGKACPGSGSAPVLLRSPFGSIHSTTTTTQAQPSPIATL